MKSFMAGLVLFIAVGASGYLTPGDVPGSEANLTAPNPADCCACEVVAGTDEHQCKSDAAWRPNDPPAEDKPVAGECEAHGHGLSCDIDPDSPEPDIDDFLVAIAQRDLQGIRSILSSPDSRIEFNAERHAVQQLSCLGDAYVSHVPLDGEEFTVVGQALNDAP